MKISNLINHKLVKILIFIFFLTQINFYASSSENKIIFKINNNAYTSLDLKLRTNYLKFVGSNSNLENELIIKDFISAILFFEYYKKSNNKKNIDIEAKEIYLNIKNINKDNNKIYNFEINENNILLNIKLDLIRKKVLENILNNNFKNINISNDQMDLLYNFKIQYVNFIDSGDRKIIDEIKEINQIDIDKVKMFLKNKEINFFTKYQEIHNINNINLNLKNNIIKNKNFFIINKNDKVSVIFVEKQFETLDGIIANIYSIKSKEKLNREEINCKRLLNDEDNLNITNKEYKFINLNEKLKKNMININDYVHFINNNENIYVVLCNIKFDKEILDKININKLVNLNAKRIEEKFITKYSKVFDLIKN